MFININIKPQDPEVDMVMSLSLESLSTSRTSGNFVEIPTTWCVKVGAEMHGKLGFKV